MPSRWDAGEPNIVGSGKLCRQRMRRLAGSLTLLAFTGILAAPETTQPAPHAPDMAAAQHSGSFPANANGPHGSDVIAYWFGTSYRTPFVLKQRSGQAADIQRNSLEYTHLSFWGLGSNFADVMVNQSNMAEPAGNGGVGATEVYVTLRSDVGLNEITRSDAFRFGPVRDVALELGTNLEAKNSSFAPAERTIHFGPKIRFAAPRGYFNVGLHLRKEWNHEGVLGKPENYNVDFTVEPAWLLPFSIARMHVAWSGFADYNTQKGKDSFGSPTAPEFLIRSTVSADVGAAQFHRTQLLDLSGGCWYWHNEYGKPASDPGAEQATPFIGLAFHLDGGRRAQRL